MKTNQILGIVLLVLSVLFFGIFIWWGTTEYKADYAVGICIVAIGTFISGLISFFTDCEL